MDLLNIVKSINIKAVSFILIIVCIGTYWNSLDNEFLMDDYPMLIRNTNIRSPEFLQLNTKKLNTQAYYRPVTHLFNYITYAFFGSQPLFYHLLNLFLFYLSALVLFLLIRTLTSDNLLSFVSSILFCVHPINGVLVNYKNATGYSFLVFAVLFSLYKILSPSKEVDLGSKLLSFIWFVLALLCHEIVMAYPLYLASILYFVKRDKFSVVIRKCLPYIFGVIAYISFRLIMSKGGHSFLNIIPSYGLNIFQYIASFTKLMSWYVENLFFAQNIVLVYDIPLVLSKTSVGGITFCLFLIGSVYLLFFKWGRDVKSFALSWILIGFMPVTIACFSRPNLGFIVEPHWLMFSSIGFFILLAKTLLWFQSKQQRVTMFVLIITIGMFYCLKSIRYNYLWGSQKRYCKFWLTISPHNFMPNFWLGFSYMEEKDYLNAKKVYARLIRKVNVPYGVYGNLGICEFYLKNYSSALRNLKKSLQLPGGNVPDNYYYIGKAYYHLGVMDKAYDYLNKAIALNPYFVDAQNALYEMNNH